MTGRGWGQIETAARRLTPAALTLLLMVAGVVPLQIPHLAAIGPSFLLISIYYWAVHRPGLMPAPAIFVFGLLGDLLGGAPIGSGTFVLLLVYAVTRAYRRPLLAASFLVVWFGFAVVAAAAGLAAWAVASALAGTVPDPGRALFGALLEVALYPVVAALFFQVERLLGSPAE